MDLNKTGKYLKKLREENKTRFDLGREEFLKLTWQWANEHKEII